MSEDTLAVIAGNAVIAVLVGIGEADRWRRGGMGGMGEHDAEPGCSEPISQGG